MQVATVPVQICTGTVACAYNFLTIFSLSLCTWLSAPSLSLSQAQNSLFLPLINLSSSSIDRHRCRSLFLPLFLVVFGLNGLDQWVSGWMSLAIAIATACLWRHRSCCSRWGVNLDKWVLIYFVGFVFLVFCRWVVWILVWYRCGLWVRVNGCVAKK